MAKCLLTGCILLFSLAVVCGQEYEVSGFVFDDTQEPLYGVSVREKNSKNSVETQPDGSFVLTLKTTPVTIVFSSLGYTTKEVLVDVQTNSIEVVLEDNLFSLKNVIVVGTRFNTRSELTSPVPIDKILIEELNATAQPSLDQMLSFKLPSFNASQQPISDAAAHLNPAELRNLGPGRTLVLINGKRKNQSALVYTNDVPGKGEVGVDLQSFAPNSIKRVEILRDGASVQYGSDAIAGVINIVLNDQERFNQLSLYSGITGEGDGLNTGFNLNTGFDFIGGGVVNFYAEYSYQQATNRANDPGKDLFFADIFADIPGLEGLANQLRDGSLPYLQQNPDMGMKIGIPESNKYSYGYNLSFPLSVKTSLYSFAGYSFRKTKSYAVHRTPYMEGDPHFLFHNPGDTYEGFTPTFESEILDNHIAFGVKGNTNNWNYDISLIHGTNSIDQHTNDTFNKALGKFSPTSFYAGGYSFTNNVINMDVSKNFGRLKFDFGTEFRNEKFKTEAGDSTSYYLEGAISFPGIRPENALDVSRHNFGVYMDLEYEKDNFLIGAAVRQENYSDFGNTINWKVNARLLLLQDKLVIRSSANTGFRAPTLHQTHVNNIQTLLTGGVISNQATFNNAHPALRDLEVPTLKQEESLNFSAGLTYKFNSNSGLAMDFYQVNIEDRILLSNEISSDDPNSPIYAILQDFNVSSLKFFINAVNTETKGVDLVYYYRNIGIGKGFLSLNLSMNFNEHTIQGKISTPPPIAASNVDMFDRKEQARILTARPNKKGNLSVQYVFKKLHTNLNLNYFGPVTWMHAVDVFRDQTFSSKTTTDLNWLYDFNKTFSGSFSVNNVFNVYPDAIDPKGDNSTNLGGRFKYPWEVNQFGYLGINFQLKFLFNF